MTAKEKKTAFEGRFNRNRLTQNVFAATLLSLSLGAIGAPTNDANIVDLLSSDLAYEGTIHSLESHDLGLGVGLGRAYLVDIDRLANPPVTVREIFNGIPAPGDGTHSVAPLLPLALDQVSCEQCLNGEHLIIKNVRNNRTNNKTEQIHGELWVLKGGVIKSPRKNSNSNSNDRNNYVLMPAKGLPTNKDAAWEYQATAISDDGKLIVGTATATKDYERANRNLFITAGTQIAVYWQIYLFLKQPAVHPAKPLAFEVDQPGRAGNKTINGVEEGLQVATDVVHYEGANGRVYVVSGRDQGNRFAVMELQL